MKTNTKKQKKKLIITITAVVLAAWLVVSLAYSAVILVTEKNRCLREADISSVNYFNAISHDPTSLYFHTNAVKNGWNIFDLEKSDEIGNLKSVDNNIFNTDIHIVFETNSEDIIPNYDTDKEIYTSIDGIDEKGYQKKFMV